MAGFVPWLDMFDPANGYRKPPEVSHYSADFLTRYRAAQAARCRRIDAKALQEVERKRRHKALMAQLTEAAKAAIG